MNHSVMEIQNHLITYSELVVLADQLLEECDEDVKLLAEKLNGLPSQVRDELLISDLLNMYQTFYYFFHEVPDDILIDRMILSPASALPEGVLVEEIEFLELIFAVIDHVPVMVVSDGQHALATFLGADAYRDALIYIESTL
jgi:hypothetical protein